MITMNLVVVEVFKTNVKRERDANMLSCLLVEKYPEIKVSFDLEDCDKVLRIEGVDIDAKYVIALMLSNGFYCCEL